MDTDKTEVIEVSQPLNYSFWKGSFILKGSIAPRVFADILKFGVIAEVLVLISVYVRSQWNINLAVPHGPFSAAGAVLGLLLVLRTNAGYDRWWEARKLWGGIVNQSRNLGVIALAYGPRDAEWRSRFIMWLASYPHVIRESLRNERKLDELEHLVGEDEAESVAESNHMPSYVAGRLASLLEQARLNGMENFAFLQAEQQRGEIMNHVGGCERILKTPLARASAIQVRQFIFLFLLTLPFALLSDFSSNQILSQLTGRSISDGVLIIPFFIMLLSWPLLSLDRIGMELQNPFDTRRVDHLPLDTICHTIEKNLTEMLRNDNVVTQQGIDMESREISPELAAKLANAKSNETYIS